MPDQKLTALTALAALSADDLFYVVDDPAGAATSHKLAASVLDARFASAAQGALAATALQPADIGVTVQGYDADLSTIAGLAKADGNFIVGDGAAWTVESGATARASLGVIDPPFTDTNALVKGSADATKLLRFEVDGFTTNQTRVITPPDANITLAGQNYANVFTATQTVQITTATLAGLIVQTTDDNATNPLLGVKKSDGTLLSYFSAPDGRLILNPGFSFPAFDGTGGDDYLIKIVQDSGNHDGTGLYFQNVNATGYTEFTLINDAGDYPGVFAMGVSGSAAVGFSDIAYVYCGENFQYMTFDVYAAGQSIRFGTAPGEALRIDDNATAGNTRLMLYDVDNGTLERVSVGAANSAGAGFKVLRIPN